MSKDNDNVSKSKAKRLAAEKARKEQKKAKRRSTITGVTIVALMVGIVVGIIVYNKNKVNAYSRYLTDEGTIDIDINQYCTTTYENMSFSRAELLPDDSQVESDIQDFCNNNRVVKEEGAVIAEGDMVNVTYSLTVDGQVVDSVSANNGGMDYVVGSAKMTQEFDDALIGHVVGDTFTIDNSGSDNSVSDNSVSDNSVSDNSVSTDSVSADNLTYNIVYTVTVCAIYDVPEFTDELVASNFPTLYSTAEEYRQSIIDDYYDQNLENAILESLSMNCVVLDIPEDYYNKQIEEFKRSDIAQFNYAAATYAQYGIQMNSVLDMYGFTTQEEYDAYLANKATDAVKLMLYYQAIFEKAGLTNTKEDVLAYTQELGWSMDEYNGWVRDRGYPYIANFVLQERVMEYLKENVTITD